MDRFIDATQIRIDELTDNDRSLTEKVTRLAEGQLFLQQSMIEMRERDNEYRAAQAQIQAQIQGQFQAQQAENRRFDQLHQESNQRFEVLLAEIRYLTGRLPQPPES